MNANHITDEQNGVSDSELRALWRQHGGRFHGPNVETGTMPEAKLLPFLRGLVSSERRTAPAPAVPSGWSLTDNGDGTIAIQGPGMGCIVSDVETLERRIPGEVLHALCRAMLTAAPTPSQEAVVSSNRWLTAAVDAAMVEMKNISPPMRRSECERLICAALTAAPTPPAQGEKLVRFCPGCGSVGDVPDTFRDCCPDGSNARMIPEDLATRCHDLFLLALAGAKAQQPAVPESADSDEEAQAPTIDIKAAAGRLMGWPLPKDFSPDNGIRFTPPDFGWPTGTNLLNVTQAEQMLAYALGTTAPAVPEDVARDMPARPWPKARDVGRLGDMSPRAHLRVGLDSDNDVYVSVADDEGHGSVEFCTGSGGGGSSMRTRDALIALMVAMEADNAERPDKDWWARRMGGKAAEKGGA